MDDLKKRFSDMLKQSRYDSGLSQQDVADALDVSKITVQNWECGRSCPTQDKALQWFRALGLPPLPYYLRYLYPKQFTNLSPDSTDEEIEEALSMLIKELTPETRRRLLYILLGEHGSSPTAIIEMVVAHLHTPLKDRLNIAGCILSNYDLAKSMGTDTNSGRVQPDVNILDLAYHECITAVKANKKSYSPIIQKGDIYEN